ncbi:MAG TPA: LytTR family DNA-binding domain-containing protein [Blastocatellia bacterium]|nr:LytTR family DNA-binding domain-containing protein [Blastocatellia bacterium]
MSGSKSVRTLIVDDESLARERIRDMLSNDPEIEIIGECTNGEEAIKAIASDVPDLVFLDVEMPGVDGFGVLEALPTDCIPTIIFVTAYDQYAVRAFEVYALDYLLKPFDQERFDRALKRAKAHLSNERAENLSQRILNALEEIKTKPVHLERLVIKMNGHVFFVKADEIDWLEAEGNYVRLHTGKESYLLRDTISALESQLDPKKFIRVHRSAIVNIDRITELQPWFHGEYRIILGEGVQLTLSRTYREKLHELLGRPL